MDFDWSTIISPKNFAVNAEVLKSFEESIGFEMPDDYRNFLLQFNGGTVLVPHDISCPAIPFEIGVELLFPFTAPSPSIGIVEARKMQNASRLCLRQALPIADDGGTAEYYLILAGERRGAVCFIWFDDRPMLSPAEWEDWQIRMPEDMVEVSPTFDGLGELILKYRISE